MKNSATVWPSSEKSLLFWSLIIKIVFALGESTTRSTARTHSAPSRWCGYASMGRGKHKTLQCAPLGNWSPCLVLKFWPFPLYCKIPHLDTHCPPGAQRFWFMCSKMLCQVASKKSIWGNPKFSSFQRTVAAGFFSSQGWTRRTLQVVVLWPQKTKQALLQQNNKLALPELGTDRIVHVTSVCYLANPPSISTDQLVILYNLYCYKHLSIYNGIGYACHFGCTTQAWGGWGVSEWKRVKHWERTASREETWEGNGRQERGKRERDRLYEQRARGRAQGEKESMTGICYDRQLVSKIYLTLYSLRYFGIFWGVLRIVAWNDSWFGKNREGRKYENSPWRLSLNVEE